MCHSVRAETNTVLAHLPNLGPTQHEIRQIWVSRNTQSLKKLWQAVHPILGAEGPKPFQGALHLTNPRFRGRHFSAGRGVLIPAQSLPGGQFKR